ncbi:hypothetical protein [Cupriavidus sp. amp6]|uniref:hypothetical protein n=1 Tax=Cupriavidus sp. amp6 TaxID=388051 RepID=UPI0003FE0112
MVDPTPAPAVGEHTLEVLRDVLGYDDDKIEGLRRAGGLGKDHRELSKESAS